ncbi:hypothetical protein Hte_008987 [Hypoxylon texense]
MSRWHAPSCTKPDIFLADGQKVSCRSCATNCPPAQKLVAQGSGAQQRIPPDKPLGQLNLRWPPSVPYVRWQGSRDNIAPESRLEATDVAGDNGTEEDPTGLYGRPESHVYHELRTGEFRLICLPAAKDRDSLIHLELETFSFDDCPEYETTSYAWGGEDGDSSPCCPIYVGRYYDVLLHTKNCWSMLRYLRPRRGLRMVWIDAICINQEDVYEREAQIAQMRTIYQSGQRVVVYLGPTMVHDCNKQYRSRSWLHELEPSTGSNPITFQHVLSHRYFSRLWIIQELLLSSSLLVSLHDRDFLANNTFSRQTNITWDETEAPWFQHIASRQAFSRDQLLLVLRQTWASNATDLRDKVFGILGLVDTKTTTRDSGASYASDIDTSDYSIAPDYSLSVIDTFIGITAYVMITLGHWQLLENAAGVNAIPGYPKWMPDYRQPLMWHNKSVTKDEDFIRLHRWYHAQGLYAKGKIWNLNITRKAMDMEAGELSYTIKDILGDWGMATWAYEKSIVYSELQRLRASIWIGDSVPPCLHVDPSTAALSIKLVRLLHLTSRPILAADLGSLRVFGFSKASYSILICTGPIGLDELLGTKSVWLYLQYIGNSGSPVENTGSSLFFLRKAQQGRRNDTYNLVCSCACWDIWIYPGHIGKDLRDDDSFVRRNIYSGACPLLYETPRAAIDIFLGRFILNERVDTEFRQAFPAKGTRLRDILPVAQYLIDNDVENVYYGQGSHPAASAAIHYYHFGQFYLSTLHKISADSSSSLESPCDDAWPDPDAGFNLRGGYGRIFFTFEPSEWAEVSHYYKRRATRYYRETWVNSNSRAAPAELPVDKNDGIPKSKFVGRAGWRKATDSWDGIDETRTLYVRVSMDLRDIVGLFVGHDLLALLRNLTRFRPLTNKDETTMVQEMKEEYRGIYRHYWPESLAAELGLDGTPQRVQLV